MPGHRELAYAGKYFGVAQGPSNAYARDLPACADFQVYAHVSLEGVIGFEAPLVTAAHLFLLAADHFARFCCGNFSRAIKVVGDVLIDDALL